MTRKDETFYLLVASWSKDPSSQVGAAIVDAKNRVVSLGFNGFPRAVAGGVCVVANCEVFLNSRAQIRRAIMQIVVCHSCFWWNVSSKEDGVL